MISSAPPVAQEPHSPDPKKTTVYQLVLQASIGLLLARGWVNRTAILNSLQLTSALNEVLGDLTAAGIIEDGVRLRTWRRADPALHCHVGPDDVVTAWYALAANAAKQRGADQ